MAETTEGFVNWDDPYLSSEIPADAPTGEPTWGDYGRALGVGTVGLGEGALALGARAARALGGPRTGELLDLYRQDLGDYRDDIVGNMTPVAQRRLSSAFLPDEGQASIFEAPVSSLALKVTASVPSLIVSALPAGMVARAAGLGAGSFVGGATAGAINAGDVLQNVYSDIEALPDQELRALNPMYRELRAMGMDEADARAQVADTLAGYKPLVVGAISAITSGAFGVERMIAGAAAKEGARKGLVRGAYEGFKGEALQEATESGAGAYASALALEEGGIRDIDWRDVLNQTIEGGVVGGILGGGIGGVTNIGATPDPAQQAALSSTLNAPAPPQGPTGAPPTPSAPSAPAGGTVPPAAPQSAPPAPAPAPAAAPPAPVAQTQAPAPVAAPDPARAELDAAVANLQARGAAPTTAVAPGAEPTVPEAPETLVAQIDKLARGERAAVLIPKGRKGARPPKPAGMKEGGVQGVGVFYYDPARTSFKAIQEAVRANRINEILDLGPVPKSEVDARVAQGETPVAVVERTPQGVEVAAAAGTTETAPAQIAALAETAAPDNSVAVEDPAEVLRRREEAAGVRRVEITPEMRQRYEVAAKGPAPRILAQTSDAVEKATAEFNKALRPKAEKAPRTFASKKDEATRTAQNAAAKKIAAATLAEPQTIPGTDAALAAVRARLAGAVAEAKKTVGALPKRVQGETISDELYWLREVADYLKQKKPDIAATVDIVDLSEAVRTGDAERVAEFRRRRREEGESANRRDQGDVDAVSDVASVATASEVEDGVLSAIEPEEDTVEVAAPVAEEKIEDKLAARRSEGFENTGTVIRTAPVVVARKGRVKLDLPGVGPKGKVIISKAKPAAASETAQAYDDALLEKPQFKVEPKPAEDDLATPGEIEKTRALFRTLAQLDQNDPAVETVLKNDPNVVVDLWQGREVNLSGSPASPNVLERMKEVFRDVEGQVGNELRRALKEYMDKPKEERGDGLRLFDDLKRIHDRHGGPDMRVDGVLMELYRFVKPSERAENSARIRLADKLDDFLRDHADALEGREFAAKRVAIKNQIEALDQWGKNVFDVRSYIVENTVDGTWATDDVPSSVRRALLDAVDEVVDAHLAETLKRAQLAYETGKPTVADVFHGSTRWFDRFLKSFLGSNTKAPSARMGFFFARNPETSNSYSFADTTKPERIRRAIERIVRRDFLDQSRTAEIDQSVLSGALLDMPLRESEKIRARWNKANEDFEASLLSDDDVARIVDELVDAVLPESKRPNPNTRLQRIYLKNPLVHDYIGQSYREESYASVIDRAKKAGHDGVILLNTRDGGPNDVIYVAFEENQISTMFNPARGEEQLFPVTRRASRELAADLDEASFTDATEDEIAAETQAAAPQAASIRVTDGEGVHFDLTPMATTTVGRMLQDADLKGLGTIPRAMAEFVMRRLTALVPDVRVHVVSDFDMALIKADALGGYYGDVRDFIVIPESVARDPAKRLRVMLHEAVHAATSREIRKSAGLLPQGRGFAADIRRIMDAVHAATGDAGLDAADGRYAFEDEAEFVAEAFSNARFQELLAKTPLDGATARALGLESGRYSLFTAFLAKIRAFFGDARISISALEAITRVGTTIMESDRQARQARTAARQALGLPSFITTAAVRRAGEIRGEGFLFNTRRKLVALMTVDGIRQQFRGLFVDGKGDALQDFVEALQRITPYANVKREAGEKVAQRFIDFADRNPEAAKLFSELAIRATMLDVNPEPGGSNAHLGKTAWWGWQAKAFLPSLQRQYAEMVAKAPEAAALWRDMTAYYRTTQNEITTALVENILDTAQVPVTGQQRADLIKKVMDGTLDEKVDRPVLGATLFNALKQAKEVRAIGGAYFPLMRQGNFVVRTKDAVGDLMGGVEVEPGIVEFRGKTEAEARRKAAAFAGRVYDDAPVVNLVRNVEQPKTATDFAVRVHVQLEGVHFFDSFAEAQEFIAEAKRSNYTEVSGVMDRADAFSMGDLTSTQLASIMSSIDARFPGDQNKAKREQLRAVMKEASYRLMAGNRIQQRSIARRNVRGASTDMARNTLQYAEAASRYLAKIRFAPAAREAMARMRAVQKGNYDGNEGARNQVLNELEKRFESNVVSPQEDNPLVHNLLALSFLDKLFSPAYSFVNAMQVGMNTLPVLAGRYGLPEAGAQIASAYRAVGVTSAVGGGVANTLRAARAFSQAAVLNSEDVLGSIKTKLAAEPDGARLVALLDMLQERGAIDPGAGFELAQAYSQGMGPTGRTIAKFDRIARQLPIAVEAVNRSVSAVASYRLALANGMTEAQARSFAFDTVMNTQGDYSAMNAPAVFNHPVGRLALQFKKYAQLMYALLGDMLHRSFKGATPAERRVARRELAYLMGVHVLMAGALGVPGMEVVKLGMMSAAALGIGGGYDDFEREVRAAMAEMFGPEVAEKLMKGVLPRTLGIDLSTRVGADSLLTFGEPRKYEKDGALAWVATTVAGAPAGLVFDAFQAARGFADAASGKATGEDLFKAFERLPLPKVVADTLAAGRKLAYGQTSGTTGKQVEEPVGVGTAALNALGLRTAGQAERAAQRGAMYAARGEEMERDREISKLKNRFAEARTEGERVKVLARLKEVNKRLPEDERVTPADLKAFARSYQRDKAKGLTKNGFRVGDEAEMRRLERAGSYYNVR